LDNPIEALVALGDDLRAHPFATADALLLCFPYACELFVEDEIHGADHSS